MEKTDYIIDVQGFYDKDGEFLPKEVAVLGIDCKVSRHWIVKYDLKEHSVINLPVGLLASNTYLTCHHHGLEWYDGESNLTDVYMTLRKITRNALRIYVRGYQKKEILQSLLGRQIINLEEYRCPSFKNLPRDSEHFCAEHGAMKQYFACALAYTYKLRNWLTRSLTFSAADTEDEVDTQQSKKKNNKKLVKKNKINHVSDSFKKFEINDKTSDRSEDSPCTVITQVPECENTDPLYDNVSQDELSANPTSAGSRSSTNRGGIPRRPDTPTVGETLCSCV